MPPSSATSSTRPDPPRVGEDGSQTAPKVSTNLCYLRRLRHCRGIDKIVEKYGLERIEGPHCFSFFEGNTRFAEAEDDITSFFLTDFFCKHFDKFLWHELGLDRHESMVEFVFGNYKKLVYIAANRR